MTIRKLSSNTFQEFRACLSGAFSLSEMEMICADLGVDFENIKGQTKDEKALGILKHFERLDKVQLLANYCVDQRPNITWSFELETPVEPQLQIFSGSQSRADGFEPIKLLSVVSHGITRPQADGTRGSDLYAVPFELSQQPFPEWAELFQHIWDHPPQFTLMHRPRIARVSDNKIILDGTTIEEVENYHLETLKLVIEEVNKKTAEIYDKRRENAANIKEKEQRRKRNVEDVAKRLKFD